MRIAIVGAGFAGLSSAKVLEAFGHDVTVYERAPDVGGVWSRTRRYPGVRTQNVKSTYALSDFPMPRDYPEQPTGAQVQAYLEAYVERFGLAPRLRLETEVVAAELDEAAGQWTVTSGPAGGRDDGAPPTQERFDHLVVANGIFCEPLIPPFDGLDEHRAAGGRVCHTSQLHEIDEARGKHVLVVGYGKSACDLAYAIADETASTTLVARELIWKMPSRIGKLVNYKFLMLTRMGEALFRYIEPRGFERFLHGPGRPVRNAMLGTVQAISTWQLRLRRLDLVPPGKFEDIGRSTVSLATDGLYDKVQSGQIDLHRDTVVSRLTVDDHGNPVADLSDGSRVRADVVVCGTGFRQHVPFLDEALQRRLHDDRGNFRLYRQIQPVDVPHLSFCGYNSSFFSPLSAELAALWIANRLMGGAELPSADEQIHHIDTRLRWMEERTHGQHARGTNIIPFSMHNVDEVLADIGIDVGPLTRAKQWLLPIDPGDYRVVTTKLLERQRSSVG
jgi:dimethylaniline monooxygenase (N-oxide forming)